MKRAACSDDVEVLRRTEDVAGYLAFAFSSDLSRSLRGKLLWEIQTKSGALVYLGVDVGENIQGEVKQLGKVVKGISAQLCFGKPPFDIKQATCFCKLSAEDFFKIYGGEYTVTQTASMMWSGRVTVKPFGFTSANFISKFVGAVDLYRWDEYYAAKDEALARFDSTTASGSLVNLLSSLAPRQLQTKPSLQDFVAGITGIQSDGVSRAYDSVQSRAILSLSPANTWASAADKEAHAAAIHELPLGMHPLDSSNPAYSGGIARVLLEDQYGGNGQWSAETVLENMQGQLHKVADRHAEMWKSWAQDQDKEHPLAQNWGIRTNEDSSQSLRRSSSEPKLGRLGKGARTRIALPFMLQQGDAQEEEKHGGKRTMIGIRPRLKRLAERAKQTQGEGHAGAAEIPFSPAPVISPRQILTIPKPMQKKAPIPEETLLQIRLSRGIERAKAAAGKGVLKTGLAQEHLSLTDAVPFSPFD